jgi:hypothetical protein
MLRQLGQFGTWDGVAWSPLQLTMFVEIQFEG